MSIASTRVGISVFGNLRVAWGTYTDSSAATEGNVNTGLTKVQFMLFQHVNSSVVAEAPVVNETMPCDGTAVTIRTTASDTGIWIAFGY